MKIILKVKLIIVDIIVSLVFTNVFIAILYKKNYYTMNKSHTNYVETISKVDNENSRLLIKMYVTVITA